MQDKIKRIRTRIAIPMNVGGTLLAVAIALLSACATLPTGPASIQAKPETIARLSNESTVDAVKEIETKLNNAVKDNITFEPDPTSGILGEVLQPSILLNICQSQLTVLC